MTSASANNKRIVKNTLLLYIRMGVTMLVSLYTSRVVLEALGINDYGIYNIVGSVIIAFSFISGPLGSATQRFYNFELGKNNKVGLNAVFNHSFFIYVFLAVLMFLLLEVGGFWFVKKKMQLPIERLDATLWAFHFSILAFVVGLLKTPFESLIIAHEKMSFYAYVSIVDVTLKLLNAFSLSVFTFDKLKLYAVNQLLISVIITVCVYIYCRKQFLYIYFKRMWDKEMFRSLFCFSGWSLFGSVANMTANQGLNILLNLFYGVTVNAAMGIANQVNTAIYQFATNFQIAFRPQIVKNYAAGQLGLLRELVMNTSKYSFLLLFGLVCPIIFNIHFILEIWLNNVPKYVAEFCTLMLIYALIETLSAPMWMTVQATGHIRKYQLVISSIILLNILLSYCFLSIGFSPLIVLEIKCCLDLVYLIVRLLFMRQIIEFPVRIYLKTVGLRLVIIVLLMVSAVFLLSLLSASGWTRLFLTSLGFVFVYIPAVLFIGISRKERVLLFQVLKSRIK